MSFTWLGFWKFKWQFWPLFPLYKTLYYKLSLSFAVSEGFFRKIDFMIHQDVDATRSQDIKNILYDEILWKMGGLLRGGIPQQKNYKKKWINESWIRKFSFKGKFGLEVLILPLKSLLSLASVLSKTTLNTGSAKGAGAEPQSWKMRTSFLMSLALSMLIFNNFQ